MTAETQTFTVSRGGYREEDEDGSMGMHSRQHVSVAGRLIFSHIQNVYLQNCKQIN